MIVFIADAPCHGNKYHNGIGDDFSKGDPIGRTLEDFVK